MKHLIPSSLIVAVGLVLAGFAIQHGFGIMAERERSVKVKGFSERTVNADKVTWPIRYRGTSNDLAQLYAEADEAQQKIVRFLKAGQIDEADITVAAPKVTDYNMSEYRPENVRSRYMLTRIVTVSTSKVDQVRALTNRTSELMRQGVSIISNDYEDHIEYEYTALEEVKPEMIEASTRNAREAAEKFAKDSGSKLGKIKTASQGYFSITDRDNFTPWVKKVRVVTNVEYYLKN